ncbi:MAG: metal-dependent transcriptional regulator [Candidatus Sumerlaeia bacterium]|nr:metal-dependent transcriptional regulator [Candidatus Sumerlaeia bacterium]
MQTKAVEDYLKAIYEVQEREGRVATSALAERLQISAASATGMIKKLAEMGLVSHEPYQGVRLTEPGRKIALEVIRHHRLVETYLVEAMGLTWDKVHDEAEKWEHVLSEELEDRMDEMLGRPTHDPHGAPIPTREGHIPETPRLKLSEAVAGETVTIAQVADDDAAMLRYLGERGLYPGVAVTVTHIEPFEGPLTVRREDRDISLGRPVAECIKVRRPGEA